MDALISIPPTNQTYVVIGGHNATHHLLNLAARLALRGPLLILDCGNRANPLPIARELRRLTNDPVPALDHISAARAFTCHQVATLLEKASAFPVPQPVIVFDLLGTFYDESVQFTEGQRLLRQCFDYLTLLRDRAPLLVSARPPPPDFPERQVFVEMLCKIADQQWVEVTNLSQLPEQLSLFS